MHWHNGEMNKNWAIFTEKKKKLSRTVPTVTGAELKLQNFISFLMFIIFERNIEVFMFISISYEQYD